MNDISIRYFKPRHWTPSAIDCYQRGCKCKDCPILELIGQKCKMKSSVLELVKLIGKPVVEKADIENDKINRE